MIKLHDRDVAKFMTKNLNKIYNMSKVIYSSTLGKDENDVQKEEDLQVLKAWEITVRKDIINTSENLDQLTNILLRRDDVDEQQNAIAAHKAKYARERQIIFLDIIRNRIDFILDRITHV